jgi:hypothetical protein
LSYPHHSIPWKKEEVNNGKKKNAKSKLINKRINVLKKNIKKSSYSI